MAPPAPALLLGLVLPCALAWSSPLSAPRVSLSYAELLQTRTARPFAFAFNTSDYRILLLDQDQDRLYLGARDYLVALDLHNVNREPLIIHWPASQSQQSACRMAGKGQRGECFNYMRLVEPLNRTHLYVCGTGACQPVCALVHRGWRSQEYLFRMVPRSLEPGKGRCPYDPRQSSLATLVNGTLYAGLHVDFMGTDAALFRTMGPRPAVRTEQHDSRWLHDPVFLRAHVVPDSSERGDDKLYFFFREKALEGAVGPGVLARVGRVCLNDDGGQRALVGKWTTFLKARLVCSVVGEDGVETFFDELRDVSAADSGRRRTPGCTGCSPPWGRCSGGSAVCVYPLSAIRSAFNGPFAHKEGHGYQWVPYTGPRALPPPQEPGCPGGAFTPGLGSTREFPDELVTFVRSHPLMYDPVYPAPRRPLLVRAGLPYGFTTLAVDLAQAADGRYEVLFLGTDRGTVQKVVVLPKDPGVLEELTLEEVEVFKTPVPVKTLWISSKRHQLYVSSDVGLAQLSLHRCGAYGPACADCCLARDPHCAWDGHRCTRYSPAPGRRVRRQDIKHGDPLRQCRGFNAQAEQEPVEHVQFGVEGGSVFLECRPPSPRAQVRWLLQLEGGTRRPLPRERVLLQTPQGVLLGPVAPSDGGRYQCVGTENSYTRPLHRLLLRVLPRGLLGGPPPPACRSQWGRPRPGAGQGGHNGTRTGATALGPSPGGPERRRDRAGASRRPPPRN
ncbi:unnamed protein product [Natator depressus]